MDLKKTNLHSLDLLWIRTTRETADGVLVQPVYWLTWENNTCVTGACNCWEKASLWRINLAVLLFCLLQLHIHKTYPRKQMQTGTRLICFEMINNRVAEVPDNGKAKGK